MIHSQYAWENKKITWQNILTIQVQAIFYNCIQMEIPINSLKPSGVTHMCGGNLTIIGPDNGLSPGRRQAIIWTNDGILLIGPLGTNFSEFLIGIHTFSFKEMHLKMSSAKWRPFCLGLNVLRQYCRWHGNHHAAQWLFPACIFQLLHCLQNAGLCFQIIWMKNITYWKPKETALIVSHITERRYSD